MSNNNNNNHSSSQNFLKNLTALIIGLILSFILAESLSRIFLPIFPGKIKLDQNGDSLDISEIKADAVYRQYSEEFDVITSITQDGYRIPEAKGKQPDAVFLGDSFTFGQGLSDDETFVMRYCTLLNLSCMNLGISGSGTTEQLDRFENYLVSNNIRPKNVYLSMLVMTSYLGAGNDLDDNLIYADKPKFKTEDEFREESQGILRLIANTAFQYSNFARVMRFYFMPAIKNALVIKTENNRLDRALKITEKQLDRLEQLSLKYHFEYNVILFHPVQDISRGSYKQTIQNLQKISKAPVFSSANLFKNNPKQYYFPYDGHFNARGSEKVVELLLSINKK